MDTRPHAAQVEYRREIVGIFSDAAALERAVSALSSAGWDRAEMSLLGQESALTPGRSARDVARDPEVGRTPVVSDTDERQGRTLGAGMAGVVAAFIAAGATVATGGTALAALLGGAVLGGGAVAATDAASAWFTKRLTETQRRQIEHGGILLWVLLREPDQEARARAILAESGAAEVEVHDRDAHLSAVATGRA